MDYPTHLRVSPALSSINMHQERDNKHANDEAVPKGAVPAYLLDREGVSRAKVLSNTVKQKRKEKAGKWDVPIPKVGTASGDRDTQAGGHRLTRPRLPP